MEKIVGNKIIGPRSLVSLRGLCAWWKHDEGSGLVLHDYHGGNNGTIDATEGEFWANNAPDGNPCGTYDGTDDYINEIGTNLSITGTSGITIMAAIYVSTPAVYDKIIWKAKGSGVSARANYIIQISDSTDELEFAFTEADTNTWHVCQTTNLNMAADTWYVVTFTYTYGTGSSAKWYNGTTELTTNWRAGDGDATHSSGANKYFLIGAGDTSDPGDGIADVNYWHGELGDILLYDVSTTDSERLQNYYTLKPRYTS